MKRVAHATLFFYPSGFESLAKKKQRHPKGYRYFWRRARDAPATQVASSATVALQQYPPQTSPLKTVHRTVFLSRLTPSGFESLAKKTTAPKRVPLFLAESKGFEPSNSLWLLHDFQSCSFGQLGQLSVSV